MSNTTTKNADETVVGPDVHRGGELAVTPPQGGSNAAAVPDNLNEFEQAVRRMLGLEDASQGEIELFFHVCRKSGLDPFNKEIYMIGRNTQVASYEPNRNGEGQRKVVNWVTKYTIQVSINGFRRRAREIATEMGAGYEVGEPLWCGEDGVWREVWPEKKPPTAAKFIVYRDGKPYPFVAHYDEFVQESGSGNDRGPNPMWSKMPRNQLRKCSEAGAIQMAFPDQLGGLVLEDAAQASVIDVDGNTVAPAARRAPQRARGVAALSARVSQQSPGQDGENDRSEGAEPSSGADVLPDSGDQDSALRKAAREQLNKDIHAVFGAINLNGDDKRSDRLVVVRAIIGRADIAEANELTDDERQKLRNELIERQNLGKLGGQVNDWLNLDALKEAEAAEAEDQK